MNRFAASVGVQALACFVFILSNSSALAASREAEWKKVEEAVQKGLPKTAIEALEPIIQAALKEKAWGEATRAMARKIVLEGNIQGNKAEEKIVRLEAEIAKAPREMQPLLQTILANWYWHYFQNNRWRFMQRTATAQAPGKDFTTWDLPRLFAEIDKHFQTALSAAALLKKTPVSTFDDLLLKGNMPDKYRPTLYDFIAHEALQFYSSGEQAAAKPQDAFEVSADSPIFATASEFTAWKPETTQTNSPALKAVRLYQQLLQFHENDPDKSAYADVDLERLAYGYNVAFGENKNTRYKDALKEFAAKWADHEVSAQAIAYWARVVHDEGDKVEARQLAQRGAKAFPESSGGRLCRNLISEIEAKAAAITTERVWNAPWPTINVRYRNITSIHFRAVPYNWQDLLRRNRQPQHLTDDERKELLAKKPVLEWSAKLPPTPDYKERIESVAATEELKPGFYYLLASPDPEFGDQDNQVSFADIWVSDLALIIRSWNSNIQGFVLEANSGDPIASAEVLSWYRDNRGTFSVGPKVTTDTNGFFSFPVEQHRGYVVFARHKGRELASQQEHSSYHQESKRHPYDQTLFFTDRALYRPGQSIQYKGICVRVDQQVDNYDLLPEAQLTVVFADQNGKEIAKQQHRCNDFGSFAGSFTAPRDRLMGSMQIYVVNGPSGSTRFNVEEYKRPKFEVTLDAPKTAPRLADKVTLTGNALSYTGAAVDGAQVRYRIVREVRWPYWRGWYYSWRTRQIAGSQEIAHGTAQTDADGSFVIEFVAKPDPKVSPEDEASFGFSVYADVTDTSGETRSAQRTVNVGFTALQAFLSANEWQTITNAVELTIRTATLDHESQTAEGTVKVFRLKQPDKVHRPHIGEISSYWPGPTSEKPDLSNPEFWETAEVVVEKGFTTDVEGNAKLLFDLPVGVYRAMLETQDRFGKKVTARLQIKVLEPDANRLSLKIPHLLTGPDWTVQPGDEFMALWGTGYERGRAFVEIEQRQKIIHSYWTDPASTQHQIKQAITESMRGGFTLHITYVRENRAYFESRHIDVPWNNKYLDLAWEHFTSKLQPAQKETWTLVIKPSTNALRNGDSLFPLKPAELVGALYDESLDAFLRHHWTPRFNFFRYDQTHLHRQFENGTKHLQWIHGQWHYAYVSVERTYRHFPYDLVANFQGYEFSRRGAGGRLYKGQGVEELRQNRVDALTELAAAAPAASAELNIAGYLADKDGLARNEAPARAKGPDLSQVTARKNLDETAFFLPQLLCDTNGVVKMQFTMPEALTKWRFLGFAHDKDLRSGFLEGHTVTAKDLMVQPNPPRFLREGDVLEFTVKISNQSAARQTGKVRLTLTQAMNDQNADAALDNSNPELDFDIPAKESRSYSWRIHVPDGMGFLTYKAVASTGKISDGEEGYLPLLSRRIFVTESLPLPIRGPGTKKFEFAKLLRSGKSDTLLHQNVTVQMVSQPAWYAVMALPYLMEYPHQCSEQVFNRLYANSLGRYIATSDPKIRNIFDQWKNTPALDSPLEKNQDLKSVMLEETPWFRQAQNESQARRNVGLLFDDNRMEYEIGRAFQQLSEMQLPDGAWPWFPGGRGNDYITLYIVTGFGRMRHLGADVNTEPAVRALTRLDKWMDEHYREILKWPDPEKYVPSATDALYLYGRSFFLKDQAVAAAHKNAVEFFLERSREHWLKVANRQSQGHLALALKRFNSFQSVKDSTPTDIMKSIHERSVTDEEMGMFWRETELSWWWYRAPIETQALMIEAFDEVMADTAAVEECKVWLLKQKQTQDWKTTKATADAVYGLLLRGRDLLASDALVEVIVGDVNITPKTTLIPSSGRQERGQFVRARESQSSVEPGTGFYERRFTPAEIKPKLGQITVKKTDQGVSWGSIHWQYLEDMAKVTPHEATPLKLKKALFTKTNTKSGPVLEPVTGAIKVGDELVVRVELRVDRDMEYVHLKDQRGSGTEPVNVISHYKYQDGLAYYESTRDTASHFFIDYLPKGVYVFEYSTRVVHKGQYQSGIAEIQCMYAPEFNSHSQSVKLQVN